MITIMKHQIREGLKDARFVFLAALILLAFLINGLIFSIQYDAEIQTWRAAVAENGRLWEPTAGNLQSLANYEQSMVRPPSPLSFVVGGQEDKIPNSMTVNAFQYLDPQTVSRDNKIMPVVYPLDWAFIIGSLMTLLAVFLSYDSICGEKRDGTLSLVLSNPVSRLKVFFGKFLGLLFVLVSTLLAGIVLNLAVLVLSGGWSAGAALIETLVLVTIYAVLLLSLTLLLGITVSSIAKLPAVSLVVLLVLWVGMVVVVPGLAWITSEQTIKVPSSFELEREMAAAANAIWESKGELAQSLPADLFAENYRLWSEGWVEVLALRQVIRDDAEATQIRQAETMHGISSISPTGLFENSLRKLCGTGVVGFRSFYRTARRYQQQLHEFVVQRDKLDTNPRNPHLVHSQGNRCVEGTYSMEPVEFSTVPRWHNMFHPGELPSDLSFPFVEIIVLLFENLFMAGLGFAVFARYDPR